MKSLPKPKTERNEARLEFVRAMCCLVWDRCASRNGSAHAIHCGLRNVDAHHVWDGTGGGVGKKPSDFRTVPLCRNAHADFHAMGKQRFEQFYEIDLEFQIERINAEFLRLHPEPKRERRIRTPKVRSFSVDCDCFEQKHDLTWKAISNIEHDRITYTCPRTRGIKTARF